MVFRVVPTEQFYKDVKYYVKSKKFHHINDDIKKITDELENGNLIGDEISDIGLDYSGHTYKVRVANTDMNAGKSNGYRIIYYVIRDDSIIYLLSIYYKKDDVRVLEKSDIKRLILEYCT